MSWGYKILGVYLVFVAGIIFMVYQSSTQKVDLVTKDYYEQELVYQNKINETAEASNLGSGLRCEAANGALTINLPGEMNGKEVTANVLLYCASDSRKDINRDMKTSDGKMLFAYPVAYKGQFEVKINWQAEGKMYYATQKLFIQ